MQRMLNFQCDWPIGRVAGGPSDAIRRRDVRQAVPLYRQVTVETARSARRLPPSLLSWARRRVARLGAIGDRVRPIALFGLAGPPHRDWAPLCDTVPATPSARHSNRGFCLRLQLEDERRTVETMRRWRDRLAADD